MQITAVGVANDIFITEEECQDAWEVVTDSQLSNAYSVIIKN